jgi:hypothetical protein
MIGINRTGTRMTVCLILGLLSFSVIGFLNYGKASAQLTLNPDPGSSIPTVTRDYLRYCDGGSETPAFGSWISPAGDASSGSMTVASGTSSVSLQYNFNGAYCKDNSNSLETRSKITAVSSGVTANSGGNLAGNAVGLNWPGNGPGNAGSYRGTNFPFKYTPAGGFAAGTHDYTLTLTFATINHFNNGKYICVANENGGANDASGGFNYDRCASYTRSFSISVTVTTTATPNSDPSGTMTLNCSAGTLSGTESDPDRPNDGARVVITVYGAGGVAVNGASSSWSYAIPAAYKDGANHVINGTAKNVDNSATAAGTDVTLSGSGLTYNSGSCGTGTGGTPACSMTATPSTINPGDATSIGYSSTGGATSVTVQDGGSNIASGSPSGSISRSPAATTTYTGSTVGGGSSGSCSVTVTVTTGGGGCTSNCGGCTSNCGGNAPTGTVTASCTDLKVTIKQNDPNVASGQPTYFQLFVDANEQTPQQQQQFTSPTGQDYFTVASQTGIYTYSLPAGYADGRQHNFIAIPYDSTGTPNNSKAYVGAMTPCNATPPINFRVDGSAGVTLNDDEAPTSYSSNYPTDGDHYTISPDTTTSGSVAVSCSIYITKNGNLLGAATDCSGTSRANSTPVAVAGPSGGDVGVAGDKYCAFITLSPSKGTINADGTVTPTAPAVTTPGNCATVANKPYFKVYNSSVATGGQVGACLSDPGALASWYNNAGGNNYGSSAQLGAYALAHITGFASNQTGSRPPDGLSFANTTGTAADKNSPPLGGQFGGRNCITSPAEPPLSGTTVNAAGGYYPPVNLASIFGGSPSSQAYSYGSASTPAQVELQIGGSKLRAGHSVGIYVAGDVYISDDIVYDQSRWGVDGVPSFVLSVKGNIYIAPGVKNLMGTYEAQKNGASGGNIYTCASAAFRPSTSANRLYATCGTQLTVTGSFVADKLNLQRTFGTLHNETGGPCSNSNGGANASPNNHNTCAAEVFEFSPSQYLEKPAARPSGNGAQQYDAIVSLPPVL